MEPGFIVVSLLLLAAAGVLPWWGFEIDTSRIPYRSSEGVEFGLWLGTKWGFYVLPGTIVRPSTVLPWWDFVEKYPEYSSYATLALPLSVLWIVVVGLLSYALLFRWHPGSRNRGVPTFAQAIAFTTLLVAVVVAYLDFPSVAELPSFIGSAERMLWGPKGGWYTALVAVILSGLSTYIGWRTDRQLRGLCWKCFREVSEGICPHCRAPQ